MKKILLIILGFVLAINANAYEWTNLSANERLGGRMVSAGYLRGKIVVLDNRDYSDTSKENREAIQQLCDLWKSYKTKPFVVLGSHKGSVDKEALEEALKEMGVTYPVYANAGVLNDGEIVFSNPGQIYVFDSTFAKKLLVCRDVKTATGVAGSALINLSVPMSAKEFQYLLDYEIKMLPGRALVRLKDFRKRFPKDAKIYDQDFKRLSKNPQIERLAKLGELSRVVKDRNPSDPKAKRLTSSMLNQTMKKYEDLKTVEDPIIVQEAKNALADIKWAAATLKK